jgi:hypothetical protein
VKHRVDGGELPCCKGAEVMSGYDYSQEDANEMLEAADKRIAALAAENAEMLKNGFATAIDIIEIHTLKTRIAALEAKIDALMLEYCQNEMTSEQRENWARHQVASAPETPAEPEKCPHGILWRGPVCMDCVNEAFGHQSKTKMHHWRIFE